MADEAEATGQDSPESPPTSFAEAKAAAFAAAEAEVQGGDDAGAETPEDAEGRADAPTDGEQPPAEETARKDEGGDQESDDSDEPLSRRRWAAQKRELLERLSALESEKQATAAEVDEAQRMTEQFLGLEKGQDGKAAFERAYEGLGRGEYGANHEYVRLTENRRFWSALVQKAQAAGSGLAEQQWVASYGEATALPEVDRGALFKARQPGDALRLVHQAGARSRQAEVDELKGRVAALEADLKGAGVDRAARSNGPLSGGRGAGGGGLASILPADGRVTDDWIERAKRGEFAGANLRD